MQTGGAQPHIYPTQISEINILSPSYKEQKAIAQVLSDVNDLIRSLDALIEKKKNVKLGAMQELLTGKRRLPGFKEKHVGYKQTDVGVIPQDWEVKTLGEIADVFRGASPRPIENPIWFDDNSHVGWVRISDVTKSMKYLFETQQNLSKEGINQSRFVKKDSLIMSICATVGRPIITKKTVCIHDGFVVFDRPKGKIEYLYYYLSHVENRWSNEGQTGSQMNLNTGIIQNLKFAYPPLAEQKAIAQVLSDMDAEISMLEEKRDKYKRVKLGMMQELLTGKIRLVYKGRV